MTFHPTTLAAIAALGLVVAACGQEAAEAPKRDAAAADAPAQTADAADVEASVRNLFAAYGDTPGATGPQGPWSAATQALLDANGEAAEGVGYLGADPICDCQDWMDLQLQSVAVTGTGPDSADAAVVFVNGAGQGGTPTAETLRLVRENGAWKVDDIVYGQGHSMAGEPPLKQGVAASTAALRAEA